MLPKLKHIVMCLNNFIYIRVEQEKKIEEILDENARRLDLKR